MNNKLVIRPAEEKDASDIIKLIKELADYEKLSDMVVVSEDDIMRVVFGKDKFVEILIAEYDGNFAGQALFFNNFSTFLGKPGIYLEDLVVRPKYRGKGIGKALLQKIIDLAKERNYGRVEWSVLDWNEPAIKFYKNIGAEMMETWKLFRLTSDKF
jgi:GNAT superfamily N-acetyltransferase